MLLLVTSRSFGIRVLFRTGLILTFLLVFDPTSLAHAGEGNVSEPPKAATTGTGPIPIFVSVPNGLEDLLKQYEQPDFVILRGDEYDRLLEKTRAAGPPLVVKPDSVIESISLQGKVVEDALDLEVSFDIAVEAEKPIWIPIGLDGETLSGAIELANVLPVRVENQIWEVLLVGKGRHKIVVRLFKGVRQSTEGMQVDVKIPEVASTHIRMDVPKKVLRASALSGETLENQFNMSSGRSLLSADLTPRSNLHISWVNQEEVAQLAPLIVAQGEMAIELELGSLRTQSSWSIRSVRGSTSRLELLLPADDDILELEFDGIPPRTTVEKGQGLNRLIIPILEPLVPGKEHKLVLSTRRIFPTTGHVELAFKGFPIVNAREQTGAIGIVQSGNLGVNAVASRGLRRIDPRSELPGSLRSRPSTTLAYQFSEQPFELNLKIEPSTPLVRTESKTTVSLNAGLAKVDSWIDFEAARGRLLDVTLKIAKTLQVEDVGPAELVQTWQASNSSISTTNRTAKEITQDDSQYLTIKLAQKIQEGGRFALHLKGTKPLEQLNSVVIPLFEPTGTISVGGAVVVLADPRFTVDLPPEHQTGSLTSPFRRAIQAIPQAWQWPSPSDAARTPALWLRHDLNSSGLPLELTFHEKQIRQSTALNLRVGADAIDIYQETEGIPRYGSFSHLDIVIPEILKGRWEVEGAVVDSRVEETKTKSGNQVVRLKLGSDSDQPTRFQFRYRIPIQKSLSPDSTSDASIPWIRFASATNEISSITAKVSLEPAMSLVSFEGAWMAEDGTQNALIYPSTRSQVTLKAIDPSQKSALVLKLRQKKLASLPTLIVSRLGIVTRLTAAGETFNSISSRVEKHQGYLPIELPQGCRLQLAKVGGEIVQQVESISNSQGIRIPFPAKFAREPVVVELDYAIGYDKYNRAWQAPQLYEGGIVQQTFWLAKLPWHQALVGTPSGWSDENEWYWDTYVWKLRPRTSVSQLDAWINGKSSIPDRTEISEVGMHSYLFRQAEGPKSLDLTIASRAVLVALFSGGFLLVGGLCLIVRVPSNHVLGLVCVILIFAFTLFVDSNMLFLALQSGLIGVILTILIAILQRTVDHRSLLTRPTLKMAGSPLPLPVGSTVSRTMGVGPDDSTAIRGRPQPEAKSSLNMPPGSNRFEDSIGSRTKP